MSALPKLDELQRLAIKTLAALSGHGNARVAELLLPFMGQNDIAIDLDVLHKRISRQLPDNHYGRKVKPLPGTYAAHGIKVRYGDKLDTVLIITELHTGWLYAKLLPKVRPQLIISSLYELLAQLKSDSVAIPLHKLIFMSYRREYKIRRGTPQKSAAVFATVMEKEIGELTASVREELAEYHKEVEIGTELITDKTILQTAQLGENWKGREELRAKIQDLVDTYNNTKRIKFPRTKEKICPYLRRRKDAC